MAARPTASPPPQNTSRRFQRIRESQRCRARRKPISDANLCSSFPRFAMACLIALTCREATPAARSPSLAIRLSDRRLRSACPRGDTSSPHCRDRLRPGAGRRGPNCSRVVLVRLDDLMRKLPVVTRSMPECRERRAHTIRRCVAAEGRFERCDVHAAHHGVAGGPREPRTAGSSRVAVPGRGRHSPAIPSAAMAVPRSGARAGSARGARHAKRPRQQGQGSAHGIRRRPESGEVLRLRAGAARRRRRHRRRRVRRAGRPVGLRQVDAAAHDRRARGDQPAARSRSAAGWSTTCRPRIATSPWCSRTTRSTRT